MNTENSKLTITITVNNKLVFKVKGGYRLVLQTSKTMKILDSTKK